MRTGASQSPNSSRQRRCRRQLLPITPGRARQGDDRPAVGPRPECRARRVRPHTHEKGRRPGFAASRRSGPVADSCLLRTLGIAAAFLLTSCGSRGDQHPKPTETVQAGWQTLADGSLGRIQPISGGGHRADRCWPRDGQDCIWIDERQSPHGRIRVVGRVKDVELPTAPEPIFGYHCAIYPSGAIEQRILRPGAAMLSRWSSGGQLWDAAEVRQLLEQADVPTSRFVSCDAVRRLLGDGDVKELLSTRASVAFGLQA